MPFKSFLSDWSWSGAEQQSFLCRKMSSFSSLNISFLVYMPNVVKNEMNWKLFFLFHIAINWNICKKKARDDYVEKIRNLTKRNRKTQYVRLACKDICLFVAMSVVNGRKEINFCIGKKLLWHEAERHDGIKADLVVKARKKAIKATYIVSIKLHKNAARTFRLSPLKLSQIIKTSTRSRGLSCMKMSELFFFIYLS